MICSSWQEPELRIFRSGKPRLIQKRQGADQMVHRKEMDIITEPSAVAPDAMVNLSDD